MPAYKYECVKIEVKDGIGWAIMNRPEKRNAMSPQLHYDMDDALAEMEVDPEVKVVVVTGAGGNFSAGQDLKLFFRELEGKPRERKRAAEAANRWRWARLYQYDKPTIAMVLPRHALYYASLGKPFDGKEAARIGMVNEA